ncbi:hypothetical protein [Lewinella sp. LCG006]|uniref:hypothetical protein n=1 Tax=Lewinella sp. LCG006 TaxID=3231911 RepID=UPI003460F8AC
MGKFGKGLNRAMSIVLKHVFDAFVPRYFEKTKDSAGPGLNTSERSKRYIVSLTSFPARIDNIWITIECLLRQSFKPDKIILWLAEEQFPDKKLPTSLLALKERGLEIKFCRDLRSHKKYFFVFQEYPNANIITFDDDLYYDDNAIANLVNLHQRYPENIVTNRAHRIVFDKKTGEILPYRKWKHNISDKEPSYLIVPTGGAGTLYPPGSMHPEVLNEKVFMDVCKYADDLWLKVMSLMNGTLVSTNSTYNKDFFTIRNSQDEKLVNTNVIGGGNDTQLSNVLEYYNFDLTKLNTSGSSERKN